MNAGVGCFNFYADFEAWSSAHRWHGWSKMNSLNQLHQQAMELAEQAFTARRRNELATARSLAYSAYLLEKQAAEQSQTEPTRSVLHRSVAMERRPLLGTALLAGFKLNADFEDNGAAILKHR